MPYTKHFPRIFSEEEIEEVRRKIFISENYLPNVPGEMKRWRDATAIQLMFYCGLRPSECMQLKWDDIDFSKNLIHVRPYLNKIKNDLPAILTSPAKRILKSYYEKIKELNFQNEWLFPSFWTQKPLSVGAMNRIFLNICKETDFAKIEYRRATGQPKYSVNLYCLRHSFCTKIYKKTRSEIAVARLARHTQVQSASIYTHLNYDDKFEIAQNVFGL